MDLHFMAVKYMKSWSYLSLKYFRTASAVLLCCSSFHWERFCLRLNRWFACFLLCRTKVVGLALASCTDGDLAGICFGATRLSYLAVSAAKQQQCRAQDVTVGLMTLISRHQPANDTDAHLTQSGLSTMYAYVMWQRGERDGRMDCRQQRLCGSYEETAHCV